MLVVDKAADDLAEPSALRGRHPGRRFVEQQHLRGVHHRPGELHHAGLAHRQGSRIRVAQLGQTAQFQDLFGPRPPFALATAPRGQRQQVRGDAAAPAAPLLRDHQVVEHGQASEELLPLERAPHPVPGPPHRPTPRHVVPVEAHHAGVRPPDAGQDVEQRGLPGPVRPDESADLARAHLQRHPDQGVDAAERHPDVLGPQDRRRRHLPGRLGDVHRGSAHAATPQLPAAARAACTASKVRSLTPPPRSRRSPHSARRRPSGRGTRPSGGSRPPPRAGRSTTLARRS